MTPKTKQNLTYLNQIDFNTLLARKSGSSEGNLFKIAICLLVDKQTGEIKDLSPKFFDEKDTNTANIFASYLIPLMEAPDLKTGIEVGVTTDLSEAAKEVLLESIEGFNTQE